MKLLVDSFDPAVPIGSLKPHPQNPNRGDVDAIADSIDELGYFGAVLAQIEHDDGSESRTIIAGEHRWRAAQDVGAETIPVLWHRCTDNEAKKVVLGDNRFTRLGVVDDRLVHRLLTELVDDNESLAGTGYDDDDFEDLTVAVEDAMRAASNEWEEEDEPGTEASPHHRTADTVVKVGEVRFIIDRDDYETWYESIRQAVGFNSRDINNEVRRRLGLPVPGAPVDVEEEPVEEGVDE